MESRDLASLLGQGSNHGKVPFLTIIIIIIIVCMREGEMRENMLTQVTCGCVTISPFTLGRYHTQVFRLPYWGQLTALLISSM